MLGFRINTFCRYTLFESGCHSSENQGPSQVPVSSPSQNRPVTISSSLSVNCLPIPPGPVAVLAGILPERGGGEPDLGAWDSCHLFSLEATLDVFLPSCSSLF